MGLHAQRRCLDPARKQARRHRREWSRPTRCLRIALRRRQYGHCRRTRRQWRRRRCLGLCDDADCTPVGDDWPVAASDDRAAVQPNPNSERGNAALCVVCGERRPARWNSVVSQCRGFVGNADCARQLYLRRGGFGLHHSHAANRDEDINSHRGFRPGSASDDEPIAASDDRAAVQPNPNSERGNAALCVVRGERRPAKWNCVVTKCGGVVGNANPERYCHLHCDGNRLDCHWCANGDRKIRPDYRIAGVNDPLARQ